MVEVRGDTKVPVHSPRNTIGPVGSYCMGRSHMVCQIHFALLTNVSWLSALPVHLS
uniref:Uncharacterized protein n=1 Tax=Anguilla anguilla TaxID=7936 RepID=A0A0E9SU77_ANGAN